MLPLDLNEPAAEEDGEDVEKAKLANGAAPDGRDEEEPAEKLESGPEIMKRERAERMAKLKSKRKRDPEPAGTGAPPGPPAKIGPAGSKRPAPGAAAPSFAHEYHLARTSAPRGVPEGWLECPGAGEPIQHIVPSKAPLGEAFNELLEPGTRYSPLILARQQHKRSREVGLVIDLTNTTRYYNGTEWAALNIAYLKVPCRGRNEVPDNDTVNVVVYELMRYLNSGEVRPKFVVVHCTHGHNRTGYIICHYLLRTFGGLVQDVVRLFAAARPPGIYKEEYIAQLFRVFHEPRPADLVCPNVPDWKSGGATADVEDEEDGDVAEPPSSAAMAGATRSGEAMTIDDVLGDAIPEAEQSQLRVEVYRLLGLLVQGSGDRLRFPGSQPVSLDRQNLQLLRQKYYHVTWKADGTRYMLLVLRHSTYLIDRQFRFRRVFMRFPLQAPQAHLSEADRRAKRTLPPLPKGDFLGAPLHNGTLLDGEMVIDVVHKGQANQEQVRRYLVYDIMAHNSKSLAQAKFGERFEMIRRDIVQPRTVEASCCQEWYSYDQELFRVRRKDFWPLSQTENLLRKFIPQLSHEADGLIFQGFDDNYICRTHEGLLKWKDAHHNSVDFLFKMKADGKHILLLKDKGLTQLEGARVELEEGQGEQLDGKIIECSMARSGEKNLWQFMRVRVDKTDPNAMSVYRSIMGSIEANITEEVLVKEVNSIILLPLYEDRLKQQQAVRGRVVPARRQE